MDIEQAIINALAGRTLSTAQIAHEVGASIRLVGETLRRLMARREVRYLGSARTGAVVCKKWTTGSAAMKQKPAPVTPAAPRAVTPVPTPRRAPASGIEAMMMQLGGGA